MLLALVLGVGLGVHAGLRPRSVSDHLSMGLALLGLSLPNFVIGAGHVVVLALRLGWLRLRAGAALRAPCCPA